MTLPQNLRGVVFMLLSGLTFVFNDSLMKLAMAGLPPYQVLVMRGLSGVFFALCLLSINGELKYRPGLISKPVLLRATLECVAILTYILALAHAPIGDVTAIFQTTPLLVILGMIFIHREKVVGLRLALVGIGFAGALMVAQPFTGAVSPYVSLAFITALFAAARDLAARRISADIPAMISTLILILMVLIGALICGLLFEQWIVPSAFFIGLTLAAGFFMMLGHHFTLLAYRTASAQTVAPFYYSFLVFAVLFGFVIFKDVPNLLSFVGMAVIVVSGLILISQEKTVEQNAYQHPDL
jgi:drug/metabolite transporter (DMT)-like permease